MFEDSLMESDHRINARSKYWSFVAFLLNCGALVALIIWPLLHPEALPRQMMAALLVAPSPPVAPPAMPEVHSQPKTLSTESMTAPSRIPKMVVRQSEPMPAMLDTVVGLGSDTPGSIENVIGNTGARPVVVVATPPPLPRKVSISSGVMNGNLLEKTMPQYPAIARAARIQGTVVIQATISKAGLIENLRILSGPPMLQQSAIEAVRSWKYKPYLLNGQPVEVETTVNVVFQLGE